MDEPTAALNDAEVQVLHDLIRRFRNPETGVIYISHRMDELKAITDRITVIRDGRYVDTLDTATTTMPEVIARMVGREIAGDDGPEGVRADRETVLAVQGLSTKALLRDVSFALREGEILGFAGLMGAGRTEVARALVGADPIESGTVTLRGKPVRIGSPADAAKHRIGYLSEDRKHLGLLLDQDVTSNVVLSSIRDTFQSFGFVRVKAMRARSGELVDKLRIRTPSVDQTTKFLSGGNQQKVVIAKWLVKDCDVLIFDEPTRGIDVGAKEEIYRLLNDLARDGKSIIMISSELPEVLRMSHRIVVMSEGRVTGELDAAEATQESVMHYATLRPETESVT
jgi:ribose transport system ATP-binding protein